METPILLIICGPTATGKTEVAFELAKNLKTEIISFDSIQVFKELDIGAAKPSLELRRIIPHHLVDEINPNQNFSAGDFRRRALIEISKLSRKKYIVLVGGTGFYLQALIKGMYPAPPIDPKVKEELLREAETSGMEFLYEELRKRDGEYAKKIHPNDRYRILRGLEVLRAGSKSITEMKDDFRPEELPFKLLQFGLRRKKEVLKEAILSRTEFMLASGLIEETQNLLKKYPRNLRPLESVGYKEVVKFISGEIPRENLASAIVSSTLQLAKRQSTWFKKDKKIRWFDPDDLGVSKTVGTIASSLDNSQ